MGSRDDRLADYAGKRDFTRTPEPPRGGGRTAGGRHFVIQKHAASTLHYDLRLEVDGLLVSWAVPKGPSIDPRRKRLAIRTEDHPLAYATFEGVIPEDAYGGGTVMIWDSGTYRNLRANRGKERANMPAALHSGLVEVWLEGKRLNGGFALKRIKHGDPEQWLLIKMKDRYADRRRNPASTQNRSVRSGRTMHQIRQSACRTTDEA